MRILLFLLTVTIAVDAKAYQAGCSVTEWGPWGDWVYENHDPTVKSFPAAEKTGVGAERREEMMRIKMAMNDDYTDRPTEGAVPCVDGYANDLPCLNVDQLSFVSIADFLFDDTIYPKPKASDMWGWVDPVNGEEYAIVGLRTGTSFFRLNDPTAPEVVGHLVTHGNDQSIWRDIKVIGNYAFIVAELLDHGMQVFDLTRLRGVVGQQFTEDAHYAGFGNCHNIVANEETGYLYGVGCTRGDYPNLCDGGLHVINAADPLNLVYEGCFGGDGYVHDAQCVVYRGPDVRYQGQEMCFCYNEEHFTIVDVTDKNNMILTSRTGYSSATYTHQGWLTEDETIVLLDDELDEVNTDDKTMKTYIWDVTDLEAPVLMNTHRAEYESIDHNLYILGDLVFQANYQAGLRILSIDQPTYTLTEVAYYDNWANSTLAEWGGGTWTAYPYFSGGKVVYSVNMYGMFTVMPDYEAIGDVIKNQKPSAQRTRYRQMVDGAVFQTCPALVEVEYR